MPRISQKRLSALKSRGRRAGRRIKRSKRTMGTGRLLGRAAKDALFLSVARRLPNFAGNYQGAVDMIVAGGMAKVTKQGGSALIEVGAAQGIATAVDQFLLPVLSGALGGSAIGQKSVASMVNGYVLSQ